MTQVSTKTSSEHPTAIPKELDAALRRLGNATFGGQALSQVDAPSPALRRALVARRFDLERWLQPTGKNEARSLVGAVLQVMPTQDGKGSQEDALKVQVLYVHAMADLPRYAIRAACEAALRGEIGGGKWAPTPGSLRQYAERHCETLDHERRMIKAVLEAPVAEAPVCLGRKAKLLAVARGLTATMQAIDAPTRGGMTLAELREARALSEAIRTGTPDPRPLPKASPALRRALGLPVLPPSDDSFESEHAA